MTSPATNELVLSERRAALARQIRADIAGKLEPWQDDLCVWLTTQNKNTSNEKQAEAASVLSGRDISAADIRELKGRRAWRRRKSQLMAESDEKITQARGTLLDSLPDAASLHHKAIKQLNNPGKGADGKPLPIDVRAVAPLTAPLIDRAWPKKERLEIDVPKPFDIRAWAYASARTPEEAEAHIIGLNSPESVVEASIIEVLPPDPATGNAA